MGIYDKVTFDQARPECGIAAGTVLETKCLHAGLGAFTITADGGLVEHLYRYEPDPDAPDLHPLGKRVHLGDMTINYHGDLLLYGARTDGLYRVVARFTHGQLEWVRPEEDYPQANMELLLEQSAR